ncbi:hypothetical protein NCG89_09605 [Spongiibacter taiwanensis]|uniref:hypothetical protein n=1 Tax=Spongiibacter taiwanensis TaxID=1748242 RepID=UPI002034D4E6|nr:hypothetical protein [Spongiibacter taiwanensis]USA41772.1 hypothetical protein NCG89_09605 [Spongiibacter taiwanensis]
MTATRNSLLPRAILLILTGFSLLSACSSGQFDSEREWRLRECEKLLYPEDVRSCKAATPDYVE